MALHPIATMREPSKTDVASALITTIYLLRANLSLCLEHHSAGSTRLPLLARQLSEAALALAPETQAANDFRDSRPETFHLSACLYAIDQAIAARRLFGAAELAAASTAVPDAHRQQEVELMKRADRDYEKALTAAKAEAHRALARVLERLPDAWDSEI